jgi:TPP-dependent pyruvate/acetoin dehydrogenase alpha subunit
MSAPSHPLLDDRKLDFQLYRQMSRIRAFEEAAYRAYEAGEFSGTIHASIGQEAVAVGVVSALEPGDLVYSHHRGHGHALAKGVDPAKMMAELFGRASGSSSGKGGSMHLIDVSVGFLGSMAVVGGGIPMAVGTALAVHQRGDEAVVVVFFGDGAINQGVLYESMNLAAIWGLPVLFVCENNGYAISVTSEYATGGLGLVERARAFGLRAEAVDGQDVIAMRASVSALVEEVRRGQPALVEAMTYRLVGHSRGDPAHGIYRSKDEVDEWRLRDPLAVFAAATDLTDEERATIEAEERLRIDQALQYARLAPEPEPSALMTDVWGA